MVSPIWMWAEQRSYEKHFQTHFGANKGGGYTPPLLNVCVRAECPAHRLQEALSPSIGCIICNSKESHSSKTGERFSDLVSKY